MGTVRNRTRERRMRWAAPAVVLLTAVMLVGCDYRVGTATGELDAGFGDGDGIVAFAGRARSDDDADLAARQPDGRVVALGHQQASEMLVRYLPDGSLDPSFGSGGVATVDLPFSVFVQMAVTPDGHIVVVGLIFGTGTINGWLVARYNADGTPDTGFGPNGVAQFDLETVVPVGAVTGVVPVGDDLLLAASRSGVSGLDDGLVVKIGPDATLDPTFGPNGDGTVRVGDATPARIAARPDGSFVVTTKNGTNVGLQELDASGNLGATLDLTPLPVRPDRFDALVVDDDGSLYLSGPEDLVQPDRHIVVKVAPDLTVDAGYGSGGVAALAGPFVPGGAVTQAVLTDAGLVIAADHVDVDPGAQFLTARVTPAGAPDPTWGDGGIASYPDDARHVALFGLPGGGVEVVGSTSPGGAEPGDLFQLRTDATGAPDAGLGDGGRIRTDLGRAGLDQFTQVRTLAGGTLLVAGDTGDGVVTGRYDASGTADADHPPAPLLADRFVDPHVVRDATVADDGSAFLLVQEGSDILMDFSGGGGTGWDVVKLTPDGDVDTAFGDSGVAHHSGSSFPMAVGVQPDGTVVVAYTIVHPPILVPPHQVIPASFDFAVKAFTAGGQLDTGFGTGGSGEIVLPHGTQFGPGFGSTGFMDVDAQGNAYLAGGAVMRVDPDGTTFTPLALPSGVTLSATDLTITGDDAVVVSGRGAPNPSMPAADVIARFGPDDQLDTSFSGDGLAPLPAVTTNAVVRNDPRLVVDEDGGTTVVQQQRGSGHDYDDLVIRRLHADGTTDTGFSGDGLAIGPFRPGDTAADTFDATTLAEDVVVVGAHDGDAIATRVNG